MNIIELMMKLNIEKIPNRWYSINDFLKADAFILREVEKNYWEFFYMDEKGNQDNDFQIFGSENDACEYLLKRLLNEKQHNRNLN